MTETSFKFGGPVEVPGFKFVGAGTIFDHTLAYGWIKPAKLKALDRERPDILRRGLVLGSSPATFRVVLPSGHWRVQATFGDSKGVERRARVSIVGLSAQIPEIVTSGAQFADLSLAFEHAGGPIDLAFSSPEGSAWAVNFLRFSPASTSEMPTVSVGIPLADRWALPSETDRGSRAMLDRWLEQMQPAAPVSPTGMTRARYLDLVEGCVDYFVQRQAPDGGIIDQEREVEFQYSTPCFAYAASLLAKERGRADLVEPAVRAFRKAAADLAGRRAADGHEDFYPSPLAHAYRNLNGLVPAEVLRDIAEPLTSFDPFAVYRKPPGGRGGSGSNWNCKAAAGEYLLHALGLKPDRQYVDVSIGAQGWLFTNEYGLYGEGPTTYDAFPRAWLDDMIAWGYDGPFRPILAEALDRGVIAGLFLQSPTGELPCGGRSAHHQWSDALQCVSFEIAAGRYRAKGDMRLAGIFKRAARRALQAVQPWQRPSGELWIVKNRLPPPLRHGFEVYSSNSQYNLLAVAALGYAYEHAAESEDLVEAITPAEAGSALLHVTPTVDLAVGTAAGCQAVVVTTPKHGQNPLGIARVHFAGCSSALAVTDGLVSAPLYHLPDGSRVDLAVGLAWTSAQGAETSLAGQSITSLAAIRAHRVSAVVAPVRQEPDELVFDVAYAVAAGGPARIRETIHLMRDRCQITFDWSNWPHGALLRWAVFAGDGLTRAEIRYGGGTAICHFMGSTVVFSLDGARSLVVGDELIPCRNGFVRIAEAQLLGSSAKLTIDNLANLPQSQGGGGQA